MGISSDGQRHFCFQSTPSFERLCDLPGDHCARLAGWTLASYDFNLLVVAFPDIAKDLHLTASFVGLLGFIIYAAMFGITLSAGYCMDRFGRKTMWMVCLLGAATFTGLTYFVQRSTAPRSGSCTF